MLAAHGMGDSAARAVELVKKAEKKLNSFGFFGNKYEDAAELLEKAAVQLKLAQTCAASPLCEWVALRTCFVHIRHTSTPLLQTATL